MIRHPAQGDLFAPPPLEPAKPRDSDKCQRISCGHPFMVHHDGTDLLYGTCCSSCPCSGFIGAEDIAQPRKREATPSEGAYRDAYERGIRRASPQPFAVIGTRIGSVLGTVARAHATVHGKPMTGQALLDWIEQAAHDFRKATTEQPQFWSGWQPFAFARWQNMRVAVVAAPPKETPTRLQPIAPRRPPKPKKP